MADKPPFEYQLAHIIPKGTFDSMLNPAAGPGRVILTRMINEILGLKDDSTFPIPPTVPAPEDDAIAQGWVILNFDKEWNEELLIRLTDEDLMTRLPEGEKRPRKAAKFSHYPVGLFNEIIKTPYNPAGVPLEPPLSFTFYLSFWKKGMKDVIFSVRFPVKGSPNKFIDLFFGKSDIPGLTNEASTETDPETKIQNSAEPGSQHPSQNEKNCSADDDECKAIAASHSIRPEVFQQCLNNYWGERPVPAPLSISWPVLESLLDSHCGMQVRLLWEDNYNSNDMDLSFEDDPYASTPTSLGAEVNIVPPTTNPEATSYSFKLFYGINLLNEAYQIRLYKGQNDDRSKTILIESIGKNGHSYYDLNGLHP